MEWIVSYIAMITKTPSICQVLGSFWIYNYRYNKHGPQPTYHTYSAFQAYSSQGYFLTSNNTLYFSTIAFCRLRNNLFCICLPCWDVSPLRVHMSRSPFCPLYLVHHLGHDKCSTGLCRAANYSSLPQSLLFYDG